MDDAPNARTLFAVSFPIQVARPGEGGRVTEKTEVPLTRTPIYEGVDHNYRWATDMLTAIASAKALGVPVFEIAVSDDVRDVPVVESVGKDFLGAQAYQTTGTRPESFKRVKVYAVRVEVSDER